MLAHSSRTHKRAVTVSIVQGDSGFSTNIKQYRDDSLCQILVNDIAVADAGCHLIVYNFTFTIILLVSIVADIRTWASVVQKSHYKNE